METIEMKDVIYVSGSGIYIKTPEALEALFKELQDKGYEIKDCSVSKGEPGSSGYRPPREIQEKDGWYLWFAKLRDDVCQRNRNNIEHKAVFLTEKYGF